MRLLPANRAQRIVVKVAVLLGYAALLWFWVFPYLDRTFINRPAFPG